MVKRCTVKKFLIFALFLILSLVLIACKKEPNSIYVLAPDNQVSQNNNQVKENTQNNAGVVSVKEFIIHGSSFKLTPSEIRVKKGDKVKITYISDDIGHNFFIDAFNIKTDIITKGQSQVAEFVADKEGTFPMYCNVDGHRGMGMEGKLIVEP